VSSKQSTPNRLAKEKSPYLLQHASNPVDWFPWGDEAFAKAKAEDKPVFLSIGYSTCHWCHVMEEESFTDPTVAQVLNALYVPVKVDREERPDVDHIYMQAAQAMTGRGGWPLTILMDADGRPFYAATYLPREDRLGMTGLLTILDRVAHLWGHAREDLKAAGEKLVHILTASAQPFPGEISATVLEDALTDYTERFDPDYGGFGPAPKFPTPQHLLFLLRVHAAHDHAAALSMVTTTLDAMAAGGIYDHIGFGFSRYATDQRWRVPHFEKMLYDNALLTLVYLEAFQATGFPRYRRIAEEIITYVLRDMTDPAGAFYSAEDADSEGEEGRFYTWTPQEVLDALGAEQGKQFSARYNIQPAGHLDGRSIPHLADLSFLDAVDHDWLTLLEEMRQKRNGRIRPLKDDKILTGWNGLMIAALARAARILDKPSYLDQAQQAWLFIQDHLVRPDGRLLARYREGEAAYPAYLDDYAYLIWGLLELFMASGDPDHLAAGIQWTEQTLALFSAPAGGLYFYGTDQETLLVRPVHLWDGALPSGNGIMLQNLLLLARLTARSDWDTATDQLFQAFGPSLSAQPLGHAAALSAWLSASAPGLDIVVVLPADETPDPFLAPRQQQYRPLTTALVITANQPRWQTLSPFLASLTCINHLPTAYVCRQHSCDQPVTDPQAFMDQIEAGIET
jgi:uncharacterized protein